VSVEYVP